MNDRVFLDTNIFVYAVDSSNGSKSSAASQLIRNTLRTRKGVVSYQVIQEFFNVVLRRFAKPMNLQDAERYFETTLRPLLSVHSSENLYRSALRLFGARGLAWYDSLIVAAALESECTVLYSEDFQHGRNYGDLKIHNPFLSV